MDSFEQIVAAILERQGYWTRTSVKVSLTKEEKVSIGRHSSPRWELDVVAYSGKKRHLIVMECKSFLDSPGVSVATFHGANLKERKRYKLFFEEKLRKVVLRRLVKQLVEQGFCSPRPKVTLGLAAGRINGDESHLGMLFKKRRWELWTPGMLRDEIASLKDAKYENSIDIVVAKLLLGS